jgi:hypothetical protein
MLRTALQLAAKGLAVFPCTPGDKSPACAHGCKDATTDSVAIQAWWRACPDFNIGIATGAISGIFVVDVDTDGDDDGEVELKKLENQHGELPPTVEVITADGRHLYFKFPTVAVRNSVDRFAPGIHVRGDGGYVVAPPSIHPSGRRYCWSVDSASVIAEAPAWLIELVAAPTNGNGNGATPPAEWRDLVTNGVDEGRRNDTLTRIVGHLLRRYVDPFVVCELVQSWNATHCRPPLLPKDVERIVNSIAGRELKRRGTA